ncbi:hypothetical protein KAH43_05750 [Candidatus Bipolaricaulota bacterium]|nr:hypothetical protein [Candidatus Bipolaricaulota bacterium]
MKAVSWNPEILIARRDGMQASLADVVAVARANRGMKIRMERSDLRLSEQSTTCIPASKEQFRVGCIKAVELGMQPLPERARVMAEIHRRIDRAMASDDGSVAWQSSLAPILYFAGAWALAARLMRAGLSVSVHEEGGESSASVGTDEGKADVQLVIPIRPAV